MTMHAVMHGDILRNYTIIKVADVALKTILKKNSKFFLCQPPDIPVFYQKMSVNLVQSFGQL